MKNLLTAMLCGILLSSCQKAEVTSPIYNDGFSAYHILQGAQSCIESAIRPVSISELVFQVRFDSSAVYKTIDPGNQYDINKLYGFSEGANHHVNSARIGWSYNMDSLRLYAYAYKNSERLSEEICTVNIGEVINCSIRVEGNNYFFTVNNFTVQLGRFSDLPAANGYQLYPYFGGDEAAPHPVTIFIRDIAPAK